jgi:hypothetical protein
LKIAYHRHRRLLRARRERPRRRAALAPERIAGMGRERRIRVVCNNSA